MTFTRLSTVHLAAACLFSSGPLFAAEPLVQLKKGDQVAIVGSGLADRQQHHAWLETLIHRAYPELMRMAQRKAHSDPALALQLPSLSA